MEKQSIVFKDSNGTKLTLVLERVASGYRTYAVHSKKGVGATRGHATARSAERVWQEMEKDALRMGWPRLVVTERGTNVAPSGAPMKQDAAGRRMFRDPRTGEYFYDESSYRPPLTIVPGGVMDNAQTHDAFGLLSLPRPGVL